MSEACNEDMTISVTIIQTTTVHFNNAVPVPVHTLACMMVLLDSLETVFWVVNVDDDNDNDDDDDDDYNDNDDA